MFPTLLTTFRKLISMAFSFTKASSVSRPTMPGRTSSEGEEERGGEEKWLNGAKVNLNEGRTELDSICQLPHGGNAFTK